MIDGFKKYFTNNYEEYASTQIRNAVRNDYADGFIRGLREKFKKQKSQEIKQDEKYALVLSNKKVEEYMEKLNCKNTYRENKKQSFMFADPYAFINGRDKGLNMRDLHSCIEGGNQNG